MKGYKIKFNIAGKFESQDYESFFFKEVDRYGLSNVVDYRGVVTGEAKKNIFFDSDVFCFPSFFSSESFGIVLLESMMYQMPLIASKWRGLQSVVEEGSNGFLVDVKNSDQITTALELLCNNDELLVEMGTSSRTIFLKKYTLSEYLKQLEKSIIDL